MRIGFCDLNLIILEKDKNLIYDQMSHDVEIDHMKVNNYRTNYIGVLVSVLISEQLVQINFNMKKIKQLNGDFCINIVY